MEKPIAKKLRNVQKSRPRQPRKMRNLKACISENHVKSNHHNKRNLLWFSSYTAQQEESIKRPQERSTGDGKNPQDRNPMMSKNQGQGSQGK